MTRRLHSGLYEELLTSALEAEIDARTAEGWWVDVRPHFPPDSFNYWTFSPIDPKFSQMLVHDQAA